MLCQVVYQTNADYASSYEAMSKNPLVVADATEKGILTFRFKESRTVFMLSPAGKLQVKWNDVSEKKMLFRLVKNLLVSKDSEKLVVKPMKQQTWIEYPVPDSFKLYWCDEMTEFVLRSTPKNDVATRQGVPKAKFEPAVVKQALEDLRREMAFFREPTFNEVALKSGCMDSAAVRNGLVLGSWKRQSREEAEWIAEKAINLSGWLKAKEKDNLDPRLTALANKAIDEASIEVIKRAQDILRNNPELVPKANAKFFVWSDATKTKWRQVFGCAPPLPRSLAELADGNRKALQENSKLLSDIVAKKRFRFGPLEKPKEKT